MGVHADTQFGFHGLLCCLFARWIRPISQAILPTWLRPSASPNIRITDNYIFPYSNTDQDPVNKIILDRLISSVQKTDVYANRLSERSNVFTTQEREITHSLQTHVTPSVRFDNISTLHVKS